LPEETQVWKQTLEGANAVPKVDPKAPKKPRPQTIRKKANDEAIIAAARGAIEQEGVDHFRQQKGRFKDRLNGAALAIYITKSSNGCFKDNKGRPGGKPPIDSVDRITRVLNSAISNGWL
jgi:hypothetical protein